MRRAWVAVVGFVGVAGLTQGACVSDDNAAPVDDAGTVPGDDSATHPSFDAGSDTSVPDSSVGDTSVPEASTPDASSADANGANDANDASSANDANDASDAAPQVIVIGATSTSVTAEGTDTLTVTLNGISATSIEIDDGATAVATLTTGPYTTSVSFTYLENGAHVYTAKATLASSQIVASAPLTVTVNVPANGFFVDPLSGNDTQDGGAPGATPSAPFKTIAKAVGMLTSDGQSIYLAPGTYDSATQTTMHFTLGHSTNVRGLAAGVILTGIASEGNGNAFVFNAGGEARNIAVTHQYGGIDVAGGTFHASGVTMDNVYDAFYCTNTSVCTIDETGIATPITNVPGVALGAIVTADVAATATFIGAGGSMDAAGGIYTPVFVRGHATLTFNDFTIKNAADGAVILYDNGHLTMNGVSIQGSGAAGAGAINMGGENTESPLTSTLTINGGGITGSKGSAIELTVYGTLAQNPAITLTSTHLDGSVAKGLWANGAPTNAALTVTITATNTTFDSNGSVGILAPRATVTLSGGSVSNNTAAGIQLTDPASINILKARGTAFASNGADGVTFYGAATSVLDLGKAGDLGGLAFSGIPASFHAVNLQTAIAGSAVGDTWMPNQQGADATGKYTTNPTTLTSATAAGTNANVIAGGSLTVD